MPVDIPGTVVKPVEGVEDWYRAVINSPELNEFPGSSQVESKFLDNINGLDSVKLKFIAESGVNDPPSTI